MGAALTVVISSWGRLSATPLGNQSGATKAGGCGVVGVGVAIGALPPEPPPQATSIVTETTTRARMARCIQTLDIPTDSQSRPTARRAVRRLRSVGSVKAFAGGWFSPPEGDGAKVAGRAAPVLLGLGAQLEHQAHKLQLGMQALQFVTQAFQGAQARGGVLRQRGARVGA